MAHQRWQKLKFNLMLRAVGVYKHMTLGVRAAVVAEGKVLLVRHSYVEGWHLPGGGVDPGETAGAAVRREVLEETGYRPVREGRLVGLYHSTLYTDRDHIALYAFEGAEQVRDFIPNGEIAEINWAAIDDLPETTTPATRKRMAEIAGSMPVSPEW